MELTIHSERHPFANRWRHVVAGDAEIRPHLPPLDTVEMQHRTVVVVVLLESATTCVHRRNILPCMYAEKRSIVILFPFFCSLQRTSNETTEDDYVELRLHFPNWGAMRSERQVRSNWKLVKIRCKFDAGELRETTKTKRRVLKSYGFAWRKQAFVKKKKLIHRHRK